MSFINRVFKSKSAVPRYTSNIRSYLDNYEEKPVYYIVDMGLAEIAPVQGFDRYLAVILPIQLIDDGEGPMVDDNELKALHKVEDKCIHEAVSKHFLYAGHAVVIAAEHMYIAFYCREKDKDLAIDCLYKVCQGSGRMPTKILSKEDHDWGYYLERLYPDIYHIQPVNHQDILEDMKKHSDSGAKPRSVSFWMYFPTRSDADMCSGEAMNAGYTLEAISDMRNEKDFSGEKPYALTVKKEMALEMDAMNKEAWALIDMCKKYSGDYDGIEIEVVKGG